MAGMQRLPFSRAGPDHGRHVPSSVAASSRCQGRLMPAENGTLLERTREHSHVFSSTFQAGGLVSRRYAEVEHEPEAIVRTVVAFAAEIVTPRRHRKSGSAGTQRTSAWAIDCLCQWPGPTLCTERAQPSFVLVASPTILINVEGIVNRHGCDQSGTGHDRRLK